MQIPNRKLLISTKTIQVHVWEEIETDTQGRQQATNIFRSRRTRFGMDVEQEISHLNRRIAELQSQVRRI